MPRVSNGPRYYASKKGWYATFGGETILLIKGGKKDTETQAKEAYAAEAEARRVEVAGDRASVWAIANAYLLDLKNRVETKDAAPSLLKMHTELLTTFTTHHGQKLVRDLRPQHITDWVALMRQERWNEKLKRTTKWTTGTERLGRNVVHRALNWAAGEAGLISGNPLKKFATGPKAKRQRRRPAATRVAIADHEHALLVERARRRSAKDFLNLLTFLYGTGARPAEMYGVTSREWDPVKKAFVIQASHENHGRYKLAHLGEPRTVYVPDDLVPLVNELMVRYPDGPLFRNERGKPWSNVTLCARFKSIKRAANRAAAGRNEEPVRKTVTAYSYRHAFVTRWVQQNKSLPVLCELLNTSEAMVREHYSHLFEKTATLRDALNSLDRDAAPSPPTSPSAVGLSLA
jgi:integrase